MDSGWHSQTLNGGWDEEWWCECCRAVTNCRCEKLDRDSPHNITAVNIYNIAHAEPAVTVAPFPPEKVVEEGGVQPLRQKSGGIADKVAARKKRELEAAKEEVEIARMAAEKRIIAASKKREREAAEAEARMEAEKRSRYIASKIAARKKSEREAAEAEVAEQARMEAEGARMAAEKRIIAANKKREREARMLAGEFGPLASKIAARKKREREAAEAESALSRMEATRRARIMAARSGQLENAQVIVYGVPAAEATSVRAHPATLLVPVIPPAPEVASAPSEHELGLCDQVHHSAQQRVLTENKRSEDLSSYFSLGGWVV